MAPKLIPAIIILAVAFLIILSSVHIVGAGERGVVTSFGAVKGVECNDDGSNCRVTTAPMREGLNFKTPFVDSVTNMDVKTIKFPHEQIDSNTGAAIPQVITVSSPTSDQQEMRAEVLITYHLNGEVANLLFKTIGLDFESKVMSPPIRTSTKTAMVQFTAEEAMKQRVDVQDKIFNQLYDKLFNLPQCQGCIILESVLLTDIDPPEAYQNIVNAKAEAREDAKRAEIALQTNRMDAEGRVIDATGFADAEIARATGDKEAKIIRAQGEAEFIKMIESACGCEFTDYMRVMQWDGKVPMVVGSEGTMNLIPLPTP